MKLTFKQHEIWAYIGITLMLIKVLCSVSAILPYYDEIDTMLSIASAFILSIYILHQKYSNKIMFIYILIAIVALYSILLTQNYGMFISILMIMATRTINMESIISYIYKVEKWFLIIHTIVAILFSLAGMASISDIYTGQVRYHFGLIHPNTFAAFSFNVILMWIWLKFEQLNLKKISIVLMGSFLVFCFIRTRTNFVICIIICFLLFLYLIWKKFNKVINIIAQIITPLLGFLMLWCVTKYTQGNTIIYLLDATLNGRIKLGAYAYTRYGFSFLGQNLDELYTGIKWDEVWKLNAYTFDSTYTYLAINQGLLWLIIVCFLFWELAQYKNTKINIAIIGWALYAITETQGLNCFTCFPLILISILFTNNRRMSDVSKNT